MVLHRPVEIVPFIGSWLLDPAISSGTCPGGRFVVSRAGESYDARAISPNRKGQQKSSAFASRYIRISELVIGFRLICEDPKSHRTFSRNSSTNCPGMGRHVDRPRIAASEYTRPFCLFAERNAKQHWGAVLAAAANSDTARLQRTLAEDRWIVYPAVGTQVGPRTTLQARRGTVLSGAKRQVHPVCSRLSRSCDISRLRFQRGTQPSGK